MNPQDRARMHFYSGVGTIGWSATISEQAPKSSENDIVRDFIRKVEVAFGLPPRTIELEKSEETGRPKKKVYGVSLSEVRKAVCYVIRHKYPSWSSDRISGLVGLKDHGSVLRATYKAEDHIKSNDLQFMMYFNIIKDIPFQ